MSHIFCLITLNLTQIPHWQVTGRFLKANSWLWMCERVFFFCPLALALLLWHARSLLESIQTQNKSTAVLSEPQTHVLLKEFSWTARRVQEHAQCLSTCALAAAHLCWYYQGVSRGAKAMPRTDCSDSQQGCHIRSTSWTPHSHGPWLYSLMHIWIRSLLVISHIKTKSCVCESMLNLCSCVA